MAWKTSVLVVAKQTADAPELSRGAPRAGRPERRRVHAAPAAAARHARGGAWPHGRGGGALARGRPQRERRAGRLGPGRGGQGDLGTGRFDEVVVSTLPTGTSKWLQIDCRTARAVTGVTVRHVTGTPVWRRRRSRSTTRPPRLAHARGPTGRDALVGTPSSATPSAASAEPRQPLAATRHASERGRHGARWPVPGGSTSSTRSPPPRRRLRVAAACRCKGRLVVWALPAASGTPAGRGRIGSAAAKRSGTGRASREELPPGSPARPCRRPPPGRPRARSARCASLGARPPQRRLPAGRVADRGDRAEVEPRVAELGQVVDAGAEVVEGRTASRRPRAPEAPVAHVHTARRARRRSAATTAHRPAPVLRLPVAAVDRDDDGRARPARKVQVGALRAVRAVAPARRRPQEVPQRPDAGQRSPHRVRVAQSRSGGIAMAGEGAVHRMGQVVRGREQKAFGRVQRGAWRTGASSGGGHDRELRRVLLAAHGGDLAASRGEGDADKLALLQTTRSSRPEHARRLHRRGARRRERRERRGARRGDGYLPGPDRRAGRLGLALRLGLAWARLRLGLRLRGSRRRLLAGDRLPLAVRAPPLLRGGQAGLERGHQSGTGSGSSAGWP